MRMKLPSYPKRKPLVAIRLHPRTGRTIGISRGAACLIGVVYFVLLLTISFAVGGPTEPAGACCMGADAEPACAQLTRAECAEAGGLFIGGPCMFPVGGLNPCDQIPGVYD